MYKSKKETREQIKTQIAFETQIFQNKTNPWIVSKSDVDILETHCELVDFGQFSIWEAIFESTNQTQNEFFGNNDGLHRDRDDLEAPKHNFH